MFTKTLQNSKTPVHFFFLSQERSMNSNDKTLYSTELASSAENVVWEFDQN